MARNGITFKKNQFVPYNDPFDPAEGYQSPPPDSDDDNDEKEEFAADDYNFYAHRRYELQQEAKRMKKITEFV